MNEMTLGQEIRRLRMEAGITLRGFAARLDVSAAHLSDIEHDRRRPSEALLQRIAHEFRRYGTTYESLEHLVTGIDAETREWVGSTPGVRKVLHKLRESGRDPLEILRAIEKTVRRPTRSGKMTATKKKKAARKKGGR
jgi:transcriptional regulator with XRE-family HTH domain